MTHVIWNGELMHEDEAKRPAADCAALLGTGVFETLRARHGKGILLDRHLARLRQGAYRIAIDVPFTDEQCVEYVRQMAEANGIEDGRLRITLTRSHAAPSSLIQLAPLPPRPESWHATTLRSPRTVDSPLAGIKATSYLDYLLLHEAAARDGFDEALLFDRDDLLLEGCKSNVFIIRAGRVRTPRARGILPGVTRGYLLERLPEWGFPGEEADATRTELDAADEVFCTNSVAGVVPVRELDGRALGTRIARDIAARYEAAVTA